MSSKKTSQSATKVSKKSFQTRGAGDCPLQIYGYLPADAEQKRETAILLFPAMGVPGRAYMKVLNTLAGLGYASYSVDLRGTGSSGPPPSRKVDYDYDTYLDSDWPAMIAAVREDSQCAKLVLAGHSIGGQMSLIYLGEHPEAADGAILFTPNTSYYRCYSGATGRRFAFYFTFLIPLIVRLLGFFPGDRLGFGGRNAAGVIRDWAHTGRTGKFRSGGKRDREPAFAKVRVPIAAISFTNDAFGPPAAAENLLGRLQPELVDHLAIAPDAKNSKNDKIEMDAAAHVNWMRDTRPYIDWLANWLNKNIELKK